MKKLTHTKQCSKCPWKKTVNPKDIPNGYSVDRHKNLKNTIADKGKPLTPTKMMSCHEKDADYCIGWLVNQLGSGNNLFLRLRFIDYDLRNLKTVGPQHEEFADTLPKS